METQTKQNMPKMILLLAFLATACGGQDGESSGPTAAPNAAPAAPVSTVTPTPSPTVSVSPSPSPSVSPSPSPSPSPTPYAYSGGTGTLADPYQLYTSDDVQHLKDNPAKYFRMMRNIDMAGVTFVQLGNFSGTVYGDNWEITNLTIARTDATTASMFATLSGTIVNLKFYNATVSGLGFSAILANNLTGLVSHCSFNGTVTSPSGGNGYNTGTGNPVYVTKSGGGSVTTSTTTLTVTFNGNYVNNPNNL